MADSQWYFEADKTYQYKVVANAATSQGNLKSAETVKNVKTEKVFAANTPLAAEGISVALKEGRIHKHSSSFYKGQPSINI